MGEFRQLNSSNATVHSVQVSKSQGIPPQSYKLVDCRIHDIWNRSIGMVEGNSNLLNNLNCAVEDTVVQPEQNQIFLKDLNPNPFPITLEQNEPIATIDEVEIVSQNSPLHQDFREARP